MTVPNRRDLLIPIVNALRELGGNGSPREILQIVVRLMKLPDEVVQMSAKPLNTRLSFARSYLKKCGYVTNPKHGLWSLTTKGMESEIDPGEIMEAVGQR